MEPIFLKLECKLIFCYYPPHIPFIPMDIQMVLIKIRLRANITVILFKNNVFPPCHRTDFIFIYLFIWPRGVACRILVPQPGTEPVPPAVKAQSLNHWTARELPPQN